ncbi:aldehyde dehydrogenase family protein [Cohnella abietis]|uniref:Aldehyde dehydrogenase n=1 Tax=Cohnella abietis TaxID=2507935 RepID=A0A3T1D6B9_9BACL|nr:aldehyde dehydrogenase family protein [Cohnella abietis]BBI33627.1 aldehyde dehydrogenase [Cohnella abietis]
MQMRQALPLPEIAGMNKARDAWPSWKALTVKERLRILAKLRVLIIRDMDKWIDVLQTEAYKTPMDTLTTELMTVAEAISYYEKRAEALLRTKRMPTPWRFFGSRSYVVRESRGVVAVIAPWNFPLQLSLIPVITALISGNVVLLKPSEKLPLTNQLVTSVIREAGFPDGVCQVIEGGQATVERLIDCRPDHIFFTGGVEAGRNILKHAAKHLIPCELELSGKDPMIVCADALIERAARAAVWGAFMHNGQVCVSVERVYVHERVYTEFVNRVIVLTKGLTQSLTEWSDLNGMTTETGWQHCQSLVDNARSQGADIVAGGLAEGAIPPLFPPTVLTGVTPNMRLMKEEIFGPLLPIIKVKDEQEAVRLANESSYGLNAYIFAEDIVRARKLASQLHTGNCFINDVVQNISNMHLPFGGVKESGYGKIRGVEGLYAFTHAKSIMVNRGKRKKQMNWFPYDPKAFKWLKQAVRLLYGRRSRWLR